MNSASKDEDQYCTVCGKLVPKIEIDVPFFGKRLVSPKCQCEIDQMEKGVRESRELQIKRMIEQKFSISNLGSRFEKLTFESFKPRPGTELAYKITRDYTTNFDKHQGEGGILLWGSPGNGKSHLVAAAANELSAKGKTVVFQTAAELLERIRHTFRQKNTETEREIIEALTHCDVLVLDDIGAEKISDWVLDVMFRIVDGRYRQNKPILYTTNYKPSQLLNRLGERIYDRMIETSTIVENQGTSYRREISRERHKQLASGI